MVLVDYIGIFYISEYFWQMTNVVYTIATRLNTGIMMTFSLTVQDNVSPRLVNIFRLSNHNPVLSSFITYHRVCNKSQTTSSTWGRETAYLSRKHELTPFFKWVHVARKLVFCVMFCRLLFVFLSFFAWQLHCLSFFDLRLLITTLVSSNFFLVKQYFHRKNLA
jgi:hypothetical protein